VGIPGAPARAAARVGDALGVRIPGVADLSLYRSARLATMDNPYPSARARAALGWSPPFSLDEALERTASWARTL